LRAGRVRHCCARDGCNGVARDQLPCTGRNSRHRPGSLCDRILGKSDCQQWDTRRILREVFRSKRSVDRVFALHHEVFTTVLLAGRVEHTCGPIESSPPPLWQR
jgi:hypothetical protein